MSTLNATQIKAPYTSERGTKIKPWVDRRWYQQEKHWTVPQTNVVVMHLLENGCDIRTVQEPLRLTYVRMAMIRTHLLSLKIPRNLLRGLPLPINKLMGR